VIDELARLDMRKEAAGKLTMVSEARSIEVLQSNEIHATGMNERTMEA
jgi:hypothetical protein